MPCMIITLLITAAAFIIIFVAVEGYSQVSKSLQMTVTSIGLVPLAT